MRKLLQSPSLIEVQMRASYLESEGVSVVVLNEHQAGNPGAPHWALPVDAELWVRQDSQFEKAAKLMAHYQALQSTDTSDWQCGACNESNPGNFEVCWKCGGINQNT